MKRTEPDTGNIPAFDLKRQYRSIGAEIDQAIRGVLESGWFILGDNVRSFEQEFSEYCGASFGIGLASGTDALQFGLRACGVGEGDDQLNMLRRLLAMGIGRARQSVVLGYKLSEASTLIGFLDPNTFEDVEL